MKMEGPADERIYRVLLNNPEGVGMGMIAREAGASTYATNKALRGLRQRGLVSGTAVTGYGGIAEIWARGRGRPNVRNYLLWDDPLEVIRGSGMRYAVTTYRAENLVQGHIFARHTDFYVMPSDFAKWNRLLCKCSLATKGAGNVGVWRAGEHVFYGASEGDGLNAVSLPQLIVDLMGMGWPATEAASMLIKKEELACAALRHGDAAWSGPAPGSGAGEWTAAAPATTLTPP